MSEPCKVIRVIVDKIPTGCGDCPMMQYIRDSYAVCIALPEDVYELAGNPYDMMYRRIDCPLRLEVYTGA